MNENLFVWTSDWHVVSNDSESGATGETHPSDAEDVATYIRDTLAPIGVIDTGDCKDHYGSDTGDEIAQYLANVAPILPYADVRPGVNATLPILPGNHDEVEDSGTVNSETDFSLFDDAFWGPPYHWEVDWEAPKVRFIAIHSYIQHGGTGSGFAHVDTDENTWLQERLDDLPANWRAIVCSHFPANPTFGAQIHFDGPDYTFSNDSAVVETLRANNDRIVAYFNGHRHANMGTNVLDGITHFNGPSVAYTVGNAYGGFVPITYDPDQRTLTLDYLYGPPHPGGYTRVSGFTPVVLDLPKSTKLTNVLKAA